MEEIIEWVKKIFLRERQGRPIYRTGVVTKAFKGKVRSRKSFSKLRKLFPTNSKIIAVLFSSLLRCDKSTLKLPLSGLGERPSWI